MTNTTQILKWYTGKALATVRDYVIPTLEQAERDGFWPKGASRKVTAALRKASVAERFARANDRGFNDRTPDPEGLLSDIQNIRGARSYDATLKGWDLNHAMMFGSFVHAPKLLGLAVALKPYARTEAERAALQTARDWAADFAPVGALVKMLDARRPKPVIVCGTLSPTVAGNVGRAMGVDLATIEVPEMITRWEERTIKGQQVEVAVVEIIWPEGTRHGVSRFSYGTAHNDQCHACGHAIRNAYNWVPLVARTAKGPVSLWVGKDCAKKLFGCTVEGEAEYAR